MAQQWDVATSTGQCHATGRPFEEGEEFYAVLFEDGDSFSRRDYALDAWSEPPEGAYCHFKTRVPVKEQKKKLLVDNELLINFFERLAKETALPRVQFRFVLALILMRKRLLRYDSSADADGVETWAMTLMRDKSAHKVVNPKLTEDEIESVSRELTAILHSDVLPDISGMDTSDELPGDAAGEPQTEDDLSQ